MDDFFAVRPGGDIAFMLGVMKALDARSLFDEAFIKERTVGFEALREEVRELSWAELADAAGVPQSEMERFATMYGSARRAVLLYSMGLTQYAFGVDNVKMVVNLALCRGNIGREKTGIIPIRGHSGVQGTAECGVDADKLPGSVDISDESCAFFSGATLETSITRGRPAPAWACTFDRDGSNANSVDPKAATAGMRCEYMSISRAQRSRFARNAMIDCSSTASRL